MELKLKNGGSVPEIILENWSITLGIPEQADPLLLEITAADGQEVLSCVYDGVKLNVTLHYDANETPLTLKHTFAVPGKAVISGTPWRVALLAEDKVLDEEWPLGRLHFEDAAIKLSCEATLKDTPASEPEFIQECFTNISSWRPYGENVNIGDCMPYCDGDTYHLFYLFDRRQHHSKWDLGAHQWAHVSTKNLIHWQTYPMAIGIDQPYEGSICTGSHMRHGDTLYAFYAVRMSDFSPARLTYSTSKDGIHFTKSGRYLTLKEPYESVSARDPKIFKTEDGKYHMLVTTSIVKEKRGALAHLVSDDLENWEQLDPFVVLDIENQPECADYFRFGDWNYLVYSNFGRAKWYRSKSLNGPWTAPENNLVTDPDIRVPKSAIFNGRLIFAGFNDECKGYYGGSFRLYESFQDEQGDLTFKRLDV